MAFSKDGLEIAFIAGGDLWVMDTELLEPKQVTNTPEEERDPVFSPDGDALLVVSDQGGQSDIYRVEKAEPGAFWWQNSTFKKERITNNVEVESDLKWSPDGSKVGFVKGRGDLCVMDPRGKDAKAIVKSWDHPEFDWSPDGQWLVYAQSDNDFNRDVYIVPVDGSRPPFNVSRHPDVDVDPVWSPDGKTIAFIGRRGDNEVDIYYVFVKKDDDEKESRDRTIEKAVEKITKARKKAATKKADEEKKDDAASKSEKKPVKVAIDFDGIHERVRHVALPDVRETNLFWSPDSKRLAFSATIDGRTGLFTIEIPDELRPRPLGSLPMTQARWLEQGNLVVGLSAGSPASFPGGGGSPSAAAASPRRATPAARGGDSGGGARGETASIASGLDRRSTCRGNIAPRSSWRGDTCVMDSMMKSWAIATGTRFARKYADAAAEAPDPDGLATVVNLMLGELNGSHLGYTATSGRVTARPAPGAGPATPPARWNVVTAHLGLRFAADYKGPGLKVKDVIGDSPADHKKSKVEPGEIILSIDGVTVDPSMDLTKVLNGPIDRDIQLLVRDRAGKERNVSVASDHVCRGGPAPLRAIHQGLPQVGGRSLQGTPGLSPHQGHGFPELPSLRTGALRGGIGQGRVDHRRAEQWRRLDDRSPPHGADPTGPRDRRAPRRGSGISPGPDGLRDLEQADRRPLQPEQLQ